MHPRQLHAINARRERAHEREEILTGILASAVANFSHVHGKRLWEPSDFGLGPKRKAVKAAAVSDEGNADQWRLYFGGVHALKLNPPKPEKANAE
jgi:hypothetical protein